jgi:7-cyano-7-deazaguanine reductase
LKPSDKPDAMPSDKSQASPLDPQYGSRAIAQNELERWPNESPERDYEISIQLPEFTCLCPRSGYPDFATIQLRYVPDAWVVELKSIKLYINAYRDRAISHEGAANRILDDLVTLLSPRWMEVRADYTPRGNVHTVVTARHRQPGWEDRREGG